MRVARFKLLFYYFIWSKVHLGMNKIKYNEQLTKQKWIAVDQRLLLSNESKFDFLTDYEYGRLEVDS